MSQLTIALLQMTSNGSDQDVNLAKGEAFCRQAHEMGADIALFPEMWNIGHSFFDPREPQARARWQAQRSGHPDRGRGGSPRRARREPLEVVPDRP